MHEEKQMFEGNWKCSGCGNAITKLPFEPTPGREGSLKCLDCFKSDKPAEGGGGGRPERQMFEGDWKCGSCGAAITKLPFEPTPGREDGLKCRDCFNK